MSNTVDNPKNKLKIKRVRTRIAPSPTGIPHIGNTRTALFNFLFAKKNKGEFIVRIEDTDRARLVPESVGAIFEILNWLNFDYDETYIQSERLNIYKDHAKILQNKGFLYEDKGALRFKMSKEGNTSWIDAIGNREIVFPNNIQEDFVAIKSDGYPTYNFAHVVDDYLMEITHVIRGVEFISSAPKHLQIYKAFGWETPILAHLPVIVGPDHQKLSKRHGAKSVLNYRDEGFLKEALINFMALLGWNPGGDKEFMTLDEMMKIFDLNDINLASPVFDISKLEWMNGMYIRKSQISNLKSQILSHIPDLKSIDASLFDKLVPLAQTRMKTLNDFSILIKHFIEDPEIQLSEKEKKVAERLMVNLKMIKEWKKDDILVILKKLMKEEKIKMSVLYRIITGNESGLPLPESMEILGREKVLKRIEN